MSRPFRRPKEPGKCWGECSVCGVQMMPDHRYALAPEETRATVKPYGARGMCRAHYARALRYGDPTASAPPRGRPKSEPKPCRGCDRLILPAARIREMGKDVARAANIWTHNGRGLCSRCAQRSIASGAPAQGIQRPGEEVLWEWEGIRGRVRSLEEGAQLMGITEAALEQALYRASERGDSRATIPPWVRKRSTT